MSSGLIDRVVAGLGCCLLEVPVGFKWFSAACSTAASASAARERRRQFLRRDGSRLDHRQGRHHPGLLAAEITAVTGRTPAATSSNSPRHGTPGYLRIDARRRRRKGRLQAVDRER